MDMLSTLALLVLAVAVARPLAAEEMPGNASVCVDLACVSYRSYHYGVYPSIDSKKCQRYQDYMIQGLNEELSRHGYLTENFTYYPQAGCYTGTDAEVCGHVAIPDAEFQKATELMNALARKWLADPQICNSASTFPGWYFFGSGNDCFRMAENRACRVPFPPYKCIMGQGPQVSASPAASSAPGRKPTTALHCFNLREDLSRIPGCNQDVFKAELWANETLRSRVRGIKLVTSNGTVTWKSASWRAKGSNTLGVQMQWSLAQAVGGQVCFEVDTAVPLRGLCVTVPEAPNTCYLSLFDSSKQCCPTSAVKLPAALR